MKFQTVGNSDLSVSRISLGCNNFGTFGPAANVDHERARAIIDAALDCGITLFDTAETYAEGVSETWLGEFLEPHRDKVLIATKFDAGDGPYIRKACESSLRRLRTDQIDLFYYHYPDTTPIGETLRALDDLVKEGKVRYVACSNFSAHQLAEAERVAHELGTVRFIAVQNQYNMLEREPERELFPLCLDIGVGFVPFSPLANGVLSGKYERGVAPPAGSRADIFARHYGADLTRDEVFDQIDALTAWAAARGRTLREAAIAAVAAMPAVSTVMLGASRPEHVYDNVAAAEWELSPEDVASLPYAEGLGMDPLTLECMCEEPKPWGRMEDGVMVYYCAKCHVQIKESARTS
jgi:aryl-alcohol dehydrogenase-like predicted oxidoreductase